MGPLYAVVMAGGSGTRFWPLSRRSRPKHLLRLTGSLSLLQEAVARVSVLSGVDRLLVVTRRDQLAACQEQLPDLPPKVWVAEPQPRDTGPCVAVAAALLRRRDPDAVLLVVPADHAIGPDDAFRTAVEVATLLIEEDPLRLVTFGIRPTRPATGYGYIRRSGEPRRISGVAAYQVGEFREKPDAATARRYVESGEYYWNSGIFVWRAQTVLDLLARHEPQIVEAAEAVADAAGRPEFERAFEEAYRGVRPISIDYALLEREAGRVMVIEAPFDWDDVGSWEALRRLRGFDPDGNTVVGRHAGIETSDCTIYSEGDAVVATIGVSDVIVVHCGNATLVCRRTDEEKVKALVQQLAERGWDDVL